MISQADLIRTLVNQNCTDESIMSTALSPGCTPPKLLEKFTEAERFDLALDVSIKLGWDVLPLWKTWAMRCLQNRDFSSARDKFRHCFKRIRSPIGRETLLNSILKTLTKMQEKKLALSEEIELIKQRVSSRRDEAIVATDKSYQQKPTLKMDETKPKIFDECMHYLQEYGNIELRIRFFIDNQLWDKAIELLLEFRDRINPDNYFINEVASYSSTTGNFGDFLATLKAHDVNLERSLQYFQALYKYYTSNNRYNSLHYVQSEIGDLVAAAKNQVDNFFLRKPTVGYRELNQRLSSLTQARNHYEQYIVSLRHSTINHNNDSPRTKFFTNLSLEEAKARLQTVDTQIQITRNFSINEVTGCIGPVEVLIGSDAGQEDEDIDSPVTLFEISERRRTFLAALVMIYYDSECNSYFSESGTDLANRIINESELDKVRVFKTAMRILLEDESSDLVENASLLLARLTTDYLSCTKRTKPKLVTKVTKSTLSDGDSVISQPLSVSKNHSNQDSSSKPLLSKSPRQDSRKSQSRMKGSYSFKFKDSTIQPGTTKAARLICDDVIRDSIRVCREPDYKMELSKLLSAEARIELNIELGKLSIAQRLAFDMGNPDYVSMILKEADRLNQDHVKDVCQHWLAKH